ncbi:pumilio domain member 6 [Physocladia obscura]|uniref:Pumilio domain member 6 n=1 Tax=Physocladia obscura TaxID=109957 RepID=A0AAD5T4X5_9FUNG|nr:pumilio domain member 6 [Physocladia obscura]
MGIQNTEKAPSTTVKKVIKNKNPASPINDDDSDDDAPWEAGANILDNEEISDEEDQEESNKKPRRDNDNDNDTDDTTRASAAAARAEQKQLAIDRRTAKPNGALVLKLKKLWETIRLKKLDAKIRTAKMDELMSLITGKIQDVTFRHDAARVIQSALKHGSQTHRATIAQELRGSYARLACSQYGRFIVSKILNLCPAQRAGVLQEFQGQVRKLMRHRDAAFVVEEAYSQFANARQRNSLMEEFYGAEFALFKADSGKPLSSILAENPSKKSTILKNMKESIQSFLEKSAANIGPHTILHRLILDYLLLLPPPPPNSAVATTKTTEVSTSVDGVTATATLSNSAFMVDLLKDHLVHILHTREGSRVVQLTILHANPKDRKQILRSFKGLVPKIAREQFGHVVLITVCEAVDDTVFVAKNILSELVATAAAPGALMRDQWASRVFLYLLSGRNKRYQSAYVLEELAEMDAVRKVTSKKDDAVRRGELVAASGGAWVDVCAQFCGELIRSRSGGQVLVEVLKAGCGDVTKLVDAVAAVVSGTMESYKSDAIDVAASVAAAAKGVPFNSAKKLADDAKTEKVAKALLAAKDDLDEPDMTQHVLVNRQATFTLKEMIAGRVSNGIVALVSASTTTETVNESDTTTATAPVNDSCAKVALAVAKALNPALEHWLEYISSGEKSSGITFVLVALLESPGEGVVDALLGATEKKRAKKFGKVLAALEALDKKNASAKTKDSAITTEKLKTGKRKRQEVTSAKNDSRPETVLRESGLSVLIRTLKAVF